MTTPADKKILIVEDEEPLRRILAEELAEEGFPVVEARNGEEGLASALEQKPDLILLDIVMPKMDGMNMLKKLRKDKWGKTASVMLLTNLDNDAGKTIEAARFGVYEFLVKSRWKMKEVIKRIKEKFHII
jgi:two-component system alkaline phosphatase synthesis response regulator PhoP